MTNVLVATLPNSMQQRLVAMVRQMAASKAVPEGDVRLWLPILGYLRRDEVCVCVRRMALSSCC